MLAPGGAGMCSRAIYSMSAWLIGKRMPCPLAADGHFVGLTGTAVANEITPWQSMASIAFGTGSMIDCFDSSDSSARSCSPN